MNNNPTTTNTTGATNTQNEDYLDKVHLELILGSIDVLLTGVIVGSGRCREEDRPTDAWHSRMNANPCAATSMNDHRIVLESSSTKYVHRKEQRLHEASVELCEATT